MWWGMMPIHCPVYCPCQETVPLTGIALALRRCQPARLHGFTYEKYWPVSSCLSHKVSFLRLLSLVTYLLLRSIQPGYALTVILLCIYCCTTPLIQWSRSKCNRSLLIKCIVKSLEPLQCYKLSLKCDLHQLKCIGLSSKLQQIVL
jgi:hypothetical protein